MYIKGHVSRRRAVKKTWIDVRMVFLNHNRALIPKIPPQLNTFTYDP